MQGLRPNGLKEPQCVPEVGRDKRRLEATADALQHFLCAVPVALVVLILVGRLHQTPMNPLPVFGLGEDAPHGNLVYLGRQLLDRRERGPPKAGARRRQRILKLREKLLEGWRSIDCRRCLRSSFCPLNSSWTMDKGMRIACRNSPPVRALGWAALDHVYPDILASLPASTPALELASAHRPATPYINRDRVSGAAHD